MTNNIRKYKISTIIPIYNVEKYLDETIMSIVNQTIGFKNIQMILVNDGSPDNSEEICLKYKDKYPDNIIYVKKENGGVSSARNLGMKYATGEYVNFMDSDDLLSKNAYKVGYDMLKKNNLDVVCFRIKFFDAYTYKHDMDYRFKDGNKVVDLTKDPFYPLYHMPTTLINRKLLEGMELDTRVKISEDLKFLTELMVKTKRIGLIATETFYYRRRKDGSSAIQTSSKNLSYYFDTPKYVYKYVLDLRKKYPDMVDYLTHEVVYDLKWRIFNTNINVLNDKEKKEYIEYMRMLLKESSDEVICRQQVFNPQIIFRELDFKYGKPTYKKINIKDGYLCYGDIKIVPETKFPFKIYNLCVEDNFLKIDSYIDYAYNNDFELYAKVNKNKYIKFDKSYHKQTTFDLLSNDGDYYITYFNKKIDISTVNEIEFYIKLNGKKYKIYPVYEKYSKLNDLSNSYFKSGKYLLTRSQNKIYIKNNGKTFLQSIKYSFELLKKKEILALGMLTLYHLTKPFIKSNKWILADRFDVARDNAEYLFRYIAENTNKKNVYFAVKKNSDDLKRLKEYGKVLKFNSLKYYLIYMNSEMVASSYTDPYIHRPFGRKEIYLNGFLKRKFVFLQHGILTEDMSNKYGSSQKDISLFVSSSKDEYNSLLKNDYMLDDSVVKLTGLPRFDYLNDESKESNIIALMPTWRSGLVSEIRPRSQYRFYNPNFIKTEYYKFFNQLINDKRLQAVLKKKGYKILFCLHPSFSSQLKDFKSNEYVKVDCFVDYSNIINKSKCLITDYSSVAFDFAYLKKPVLYSQFDKGSLYDVHRIYRNESKYNYEKEGFGDVVYDYESTVNKIIDMINSNFENKECYIKRIDKYFEYIDKNNCKRVYNNIKEMLKKE